jgi:hypothetical protein
MKICICCKIEKSENFFSPCKKAKDGLKSTCKKCRSIQHCLYYHDPKNHERIRNNQNFFRNSPENLWKKEKLKIYHAESYRKQSQDKEYKRKVKRAAAERWRRRTPAGVFKYYKRGAKDRDLVFEITIEDINNFWQKPCDYCGDTIEKVGLDRVDNTKGYFLENLVPCCKKCNYMKTNMTLREFRNRIEKIYFHFVENPMKLLKD